ncbi:Pentatricopeptide repeat-containing protein [Vitis vinifera]|uniref:Pentatricopeptide repeat-containing protein n=1 Tax=Vitis vinifera TaxID=29760 RepID=A0A438KLJ8_VITVI|nr:Pentatricopeptide repeat-containing protein [Vitis vinifera]
MREPNVISFTSLMAGFIKVGRPKSALLIFCKMLESWVLPNAFTFATVVNACSMLADLRTGQKIHSHVETFGVQCNLVVCSSLIDMYGKCNNVDDARRVFDGMDYRNVVSWTSMITAVINACASLGRLVSGKVAHAAVIRRGHESNDVVASALVDMYAKCGCIGYSDKEMLDRRIKPNDVTFVGVLHACSHSGLVDDGLEYLHSMHKKHGVVPDTKHYTCVVDMLGRTGRLDEAHQLAKSIQVEPDQGALLWGTLLSASRLYGRVDIAVEASKWLIESNQQVAAAYVTMSNTYAMAGKWENVHSIRYEMKHYGVYKEPGCSWVEIRDSAYVFYAGDVSLCARGSEVASLLRELERRMKERVMWEEAGGWCLLMWKRRPRRK